MKVLHRDMKPQNVFIMNDAAETLRIGDFGLASRQQTGGKTSRVGTPAYLAPEMLQHESCGEGVDLWGLVSPLPCYANLCYCLRVPC